MANRDTCGTPWRVLPKKVAGAVALALLVAAPAGIAGESPTSGQQPVAKAQPIYRNPAYSFKQRAADLVSRMTLKEEVAQMQNAAPAIPRLGVPAYNWWSEGLHGVARAGAATVFPQSIGLAATFDVPLLHQVGQVVGLEARAKHDLFLREDKRGRYQGLTLWAPNINIDRDPRWGRGQETYGEDPYLTSRMGVAFVRGMQGDNAKYLRVDATAKHFVAYSGPESERHHFDARVSQSDLYDTYLPAFQALVQKGKVAAIMSAYNSVNGVPASANKHLLRDILRKQWGFNGYVVSDCDAVADIYQHHKTVATAAQAAALAVKNGVELNCGTTYASLVEAVHEGLISKADIDKAVSSLMLARFKLGMFDPPGKVPWTHLPYSVVQSPAHTALACRAARESIVMLKNNGVLPLSSDLKRLAVIGPTADDIDALLGDYYGSPKAPVTILQGIRQALPHTQVTYVHGANLVEGRDDPMAASAIPSRYLRPAAGSNVHGLQGEYFHGRDLKGAPVLARVDADVDFRWYLGTPTSALVTHGKMPADQALTRNDYSVRWSGRLLPPVSGSYELDVATNSGFRLYVNGKLVLDKWHWDTHNHIDMAKVAVPLQAGKSYAIRLEYFENQGESAIRLGWRLPGAKPAFQAALDAARNADAVVFVGGLTDAVVGEEMKMDHPGFSGGDRTSLRLPAPQRKLLKALYATGKPVVLVLTTGSAQAIDWAQQHLPGILVAWYPGQCGGTAVADVLFGKTDPSGHLPVTFYKSVKQLPPFDDYAMAGRTYRYFKGQPLYPFGYGLSYTHFAYSDLRLDHSRVGPDGKLVVSFKVTNTGKRAGDAVVQLYLRPIDSKHMRLRKTLRDFKRISLQPGQARVVSFTIVPATDLHYYDVDKHAYAVEPGAYDVQVGASSADIRLKQRFDVD
ncbi:MAG TPA: glycoside hydrolase family 3 C-terminal domain-containing protein [Rhodanobacteraceae bacterium]